MRELTHLSLFSGIGGLDIAAEWAGFKTIGQCEWADYPTKVLEKHWPDVPRWKDIRTLTGESFYERTDRRTVDIISGGFPCQPFSVAGKRRGKEDDRYLWPEMVRVIKELRPAWVIGENVAGIVKMALPDILSELETCGYRARAFLIPACAVGARHRRYRVAIVGYSEHNGLSAAEIARSIETAGRGQQKGKDAACKLTGASEPRDGENVANPEGTRNRMLSDEWKEQGQKKSDINGRSEDVQHTNSTGCQEQHPSGEPDDKGFPDRGCNEGDVCNTAGEGLPDGTSRTLGGCGAPKPEFERPDSNVSNANDGSGAVRGHWELPAAKEAGGRRHDNGGRKEEHESGERRTAQPGLGRMADGLSSGMDREFMIDHYWDQEPDIPRMAKGIPDRVGRLKALGNAVVPQQFYPIFKAVADAEMEAQSHDQSGTKGAV